MWPTIFFFLVVFVTFLCIWIGVRVIRHGDAKPLRELQINGVPLPDPKDPRWLKSANRYELKCGKFCVDSRYDPEGRITLGSETLGYSKAYYHAVLDSWDKHRIAELKQLAEQELAKPKREVK